MKNEIINSLRELKVELSKKFGIEQIVLFGSYARDDATANSDIDIAILKIKKKDYFKRVQAKYFLEEKLNKKVDLGYFDSIRTIIKDQIRKEMIYV
jgi:predicted nucleotidyltransferase